jgi:hypothetical protein
LTAAYRDFEIPAGGTVEFVVDVVGGPADLTGYTGSMQIRAQRSDVAPLATVDPAGITVDSFNRQVTVRIPSSATSGYLWERGVYDLYITGPTGDAWPIVEGRVTTSLAVTRS